MKTKTIISGLLVSFLLLGLGYCGNSNRDKEEKVTKESYVEDMQNYAKPICEKMMSCMAEEMKKHMPNVDDAQIEKLKEQCVSNMIKFSKEDIKDIEETKKENLPTREEMQACLDALSNATCDQIRNNQIEACNKLNKYSTNPQ
ncbi:MAG: hypothetical protein KatS3mg129_0070 [Leptospiraceae bacterium]|nr:MAG: hypothetical protein KatS3mg129_0070 [Leptospiraceae bacterium]